MKGQELEETHLIPLIKRGDKGAFTELYRLYYYDLCNYAFSYIKRTDISEEVVQDVFFNIWKLRKEWNPIDKPRAYLYKAVRNKSLDYLKHRKIEMQWEIDYKESNINTDDMAEQGHDRQELKKAIKSVVEQLPERRKTIFLLSREHGLSYKEIAEVLELSVKTVEVQIGRTFKAMRDKLSDFLD